MTRLDDRRGAVHRLVEQVATDGCPPRRCDWRTIRRAKNAGLIHFSVKHGQYRVGPEPAATAGATKRDWEI